MPGTLVIIGGNNKASHVEVLSEVVSQMRGGRLAVLVTATGKEPDENFASVQRLFADAGLPPERCVLIPLYAEGVADRQGRNFINGDAAGLCELLEGVTAVWFNGGSQTHTAKALLREDGSDTAFLAAIRRTYENGGVLAGSSAGAAVMSRGMICGGDSKGTVCLEPAFGLQAEKETEDLRKGKRLLLSRGLGFFPEGIVDQHFNKRPRLLRSLESALRDPFRTGVAYSISEDTALVYRDGAFTVLGAAAVYVFDCRRAVSSGRGCYSGVLMHALQRGDRFDCRSMRAELAVQKTEKPVSFEKEIFSGGVTDSPVFDGMLSGLLCGSEASLYRDAESGRPYLRAAALYDCGEEELLLELRYYKNPDTAGRTDGHTSFTNVTLDCSVRRIS